MKFKFIRGRYGVAWFFDYESKLNTEDQINLNNAYHHAVKEISWRKPVLNQLPQLRTFLTYLCQS